MKRKREFALWIHCMPEGDDADRFCEHWSCSKCNHDIIENPRFFVLSGKLDFKFCPYCGVKMKQIDERVVVVEYKYDIDNDNNHKKKK